MNSTQGPSYIPLVSQPRRDNAPGENDIADAVPQQRQTASGQSVQVKSLDKWNIEGISLSDNAPANIDNLLQAVNKRLTLMHEMAAVKLTLNTPVFDPAQEQKVLQSTAKHAQDIGLDTEFSQHFVKKQMEAAKYIQEQSTLSPAHLSQNEAERKKTELREEIAKLTQQSLNALIPITQNISSGQLSTPFKSALTRTLESFPDGTPLKDETIQRILLESLSTPVEQN